MNVAEISKAGQEKLKACFLEDQHLMKVVGLRTVTDLNRAILAGHITELINVVEALQERKVASVADSIKAGGQRLVLLAGPSSSGKTTSSKRIAIQLAAIGLRPRTISMDDYFVDRVRTPKDENGEYDYECLQALDVPLFNKQLLALMGGDEVELPVYDFKSGKSMRGGKKMRMDKNDVLIVEGIHALNPDLTPEIERERKFQLYVSALTTIQLDDKRYVSTTDNRLVRRIVRDHKYRNYSAQDTIRRWPSVRAGEEKWIFPFQENCDMMLNSALIYELAVLRNHVLPMLEEVPEDSPEYAEADRIHDLVSFFQPITDRQIPYTSLLREFLGGSSFHY
ncbi:MAG: nucleoside kinase [Bacteroidaceae bacterium]|nr:nucleoside kinase [Bacteroidaceae bacterium]